MVFKDLKAFLDRKVQPVFLEIQDCLVPVVHLVSTELLDLQVRKDPRDPAEPQEHRVGQVCRDLRELPD